MALKTKEDPGAELPKTPTSTPATKPAINGAPAPRVNEDVERRLNPYIAANPKSLERYITLVKENPDRAVRTLMLKDMQAHEGEMRLIEKQIPAAREWYGKQTPDVKAEIDKRVAEAHPYYKDQAFVQAVVNERNWQNRLPLAPTKRLAETGIGP